MTASRPSRLDVADQDLTEAIRNLGCPRVLVIGDAILDRYTWGDAERISPEAPVPVLRSVRQEHRLGGAASVGYLLRGLGAQVTLVGLTGHDAEGDSLRTLLAEQEIACDAVLADPTRPTTLKERVMGAAQGRNGHQILRIDRERRDPPPEWALREMLRRLPELIDRHEIVLVADYRKGVCVPELVGTVIAQARAKGKRVIIDPARGVDYRNYAGASAVTPNRLEAQDAAGRPIARPEDALKIGPELLRQFDLEAAIITLDRDGIVMAVRGEPEARQFPTRPRQVYDITGAGDMVLAILGICLAAGGSYDVAVRLANLAGGLEVEKVGVVAVTREEILAELDNRPKARPAKVLPLAALLAAIDARRQSGDRIVMTNGCFDILHRGHLQALEDAAALGDCLVVAINSDASVRQLKGPGRPILPAADRAAIVAALTMVDFVTIFEADTPLNVIQNILPDVLVKGADYAGEYIAGRAEVEANGGRVVLGRLLEGISTTDIVRRIRELG